MGKSPNGHPGQQAGLGNPPMSRLKGPQFLDDTIHTRYGNVPNFIRERGHKHGLEATEVYEVLKGRHSPNAPLLKAIEEALDVVTPAAWWGWGSPHKPNGGRR